MRSEFPHGREASPRAALWPVLAPGRAPPPYSSSDLETNVGYRIVEIPLQDGQKFGIARQIPEMLIEESGSSPTSARVGRSQRRSQQFASCRRGLLPAREHHAERIRRT